MTNDLLADDHAEVDALFRDLWPAFDRGGARDVFEKLDYLWARLAVHIRAEHLHLFPALLSAAAAGDVSQGDAPTPDEVGAAVERLREDHDFFMRELAGAVNAARGLTAQDGLTVRDTLPRIKGRVSAVAERLAEHNRVEERQVYLWPAVLLGEAALADLGREMKREIENLPPRFSEAEPR